MTKCLTIYALCAIITFTTILSISGQAAEMKQDECRVFATIENRASSSIEVLAIRWLDEAEGRWHEQQMADGEIGAKDSRIFKVNVLGFENRTLSLQARFRFLPKTPSAKHREEKLSSQVHVPNCQSGNKATLRIADFR